MYDIRDIWAFAWKRKWLIVIPLILVSVAVYAGSFLMTPEYEASTIIAISEEVRLSSDLQRMLGIEPSYRRNQQRREQLAGYYNELTSSKFLRQLSDQLQLDQNPEIDAEAQKLLMLQPTADIAEIKFDLLQDKLKNKVGVDFAAQDQILIYAQSTDPNLARDIANTLGEIFVEERLRQELTSIRTSQDFSDIQLQKYEAQLKEKIDQRTQLERDIQRIQLPEAIASESNRSNISSEISRSQSEAEEYFNEEKRLLTAMTSSGIASSRLTLRESDQHMLLKRDLRSSLRSLAELMSKHVWSDPQILNLKLRQNTLVQSIENDNRVSVEDQFSDVPADVREELVKLFNARTNHEYLYSKGTYLRSSLNELTDKINLAPEYQARLTRLNEDIVTATDIRDRFARQQESSSISQALLQDASSSKYRVVEPAKRPLEPFKPKRNTIALAGIVLGLMIGIGAAIVAELMDNSLKKVEDVESVLGLPVLGITPKADFLQKIRAIHK